jgi:hypothetical protein
LEALKMENCLHHPLHVKQPKRDISLEGWLDSLGEPSEEEIMHMEQEFKMFTQSKLFLNPPLSPSNTTNYYPLKEA